MSPARRVNPGRSDPFVVFQLNIVASFAQFVRPITKERQTDGIRAAKQRGVYRGRNRKLTPEYVVVAPELIESGVPTAEVARRMSVDRSTLYRSLARHE